MTNRLLEDAIKLAISGYTPDTDGFSALFDRFNDAVSKGLIHSPRQPNINGTDLFFDKCHFRDTLHVASYMPDVACEIIHLTTNIGCRTGDLRKSAIASYVRTFFNARGLIDYVASIDCYYSHTTSDLKHGVIGCVKVTPCNGINTFLRVLDFNIALLDLKYILHAFSYKLSVKRGLLNRAIERDVNSYINVNVLNKQLFKGAKVLHR